VGAASVTETLTLGNDSLTLTAAPGLGGALLRFEARRRGAGTLPEPVFRPADPAAVGAVPFEPNASACYPLVPWVSRLSPAVLPTGGEPLPIPPTRPDEAYPIHGWGAYRGWTVLASDGASASLALEHEGPPPFAARLDYALEGASLRMVLTATNRFERAVGLGLGFHPWLPRHPGGTLEAPAEIVWLSGEDKIPTVAAKPPADWDFARPRPLPGRDLDNGFAGWTGQARYEWPAADGRWRLDVESDCDQYIVYAPAGRPFFCFEPVSHKPSPGQTGGLDGLVLVEPGASLLRAARFTVTPPA
jgi:aldose 1-epimerase